MWRPQASLAWGCGFSSRSEKGGRYEPVHTAFLPPGKLAERTSESWAVAWWRANLDVMHFVGLKAKADASTRPCAAGAHPFAQTARSHFARAAASGATAHQDRGSTCCASLILRKHIGRMLGWAYLRSEVCIRGLSGVPDTGQELPCLLGEGLYCWLGFCWLVHKVV